MPAPTDAIELAIRAMREDMATTESRITELEAELAKTREHRGQLSKGLYALDPLWASENPRTKPGPKGKAWKGAGGSRISPQRLERVAALAQEHFNGRTFNAAEMAEATGLHLTTVHKVLRVLHDQDRIQLDHRGGERGTTKYFRVAAPAEQGGNE